MVTVFREPGRFAGWPANYGIWHWGDEIVVGFTVGAHRTVRARPRHRQTPAGRQYAGAQPRPGPHLALEDFNGARPDGRGFSADEHMNAGLRLAEVMSATTAAIPNAPLNFHHPDFALMLARTGLARGVFSFFYLSYRPLPQLGRSIPPAHVREHGHRRPHGLSDWGAHSALFFLTANKADGKEGKVICVRTRRWRPCRFKLLSEVGGEAQRPRRFRHHAGEPAIAIGGRILCARRCRRGRAAMSWIDLYASDDLGRSWRFVNRPVAFQRAGHSGNPPCLKLLSDGRLLLVYGNRDRPFSICARLSADDGHSWSDEIVLRPGGANGDMGYPSARSCSMMIRWWPPTTSMIGPMAMASASSKRSSGSRELFKQCPAKSQFCRGDKLPFRRAIADNAIRLINSSRC